MSTLAQLLANIENAQKSSGPVTPEGKAASSQNAVKHGLSNNRSFHLLPEEDPDEWNALHARFYDEYNPQSETELTIVRNAANHEWLRARAVRFQDHCIFENMNIPAKEHFALYMRYEAQHERGFFRCINELKKLREQKKKEQIGFVSQKQKQQAENRAAEAMKLKRERFEFQKEVFQTREKGQKAAPATVKLDETAPDGAKIAA
jgi:hypothetical protein